MPPLEEQNPWVSILVMAILLTVYFLPCIVAHNRDHRNHTPILLVNLFLGWTGLGWLLALIWATTDNVKPRDPEGK